MRVRRLEEWRILDRNGNRMTGQTMTIPRMEKRKKERKRRTMRTSSLEELKDRSVRNMTTPASAVVYMAQRKMDQKSWPIICPNWVYGKKE